MIYKLWKEKKVVIICIAVSILAIIIIYSILALEASIAKPDDSAMDIIDTIQTENSNTNTDITELKIKKVENERDYGRIKTITFEIYEENGDVNILKEKILKCDNVTVTLQEYLDTIQYKVESIGLVGNTFYLQINKDKKEEQRQIVGIVSLEDNFSINDWYSLTEGIYNSVDVQAECLCEFKDEKANKHYLYVYKEK